MINGAQGFFKKGFGIASSTGRDSWLLGLVNSAPYLCCAFIGCWLTEPMNARFGRRGTVFVACVISALACFWQGFTSKNTSSRIRMAFSTVLTNRVVDTWWHMFIARFALGLGIGPKSATTREYPNIWHLLQNMKLTSLMKPSLLLSVLHPRYEVPWSCNGKCGQHSVSCWDTLLTLPSIL